MTRMLSLDNIEHLAIGSAFLGTGGGGDPYIGSLLCREAIREYGPVPLISPDELKDEDSVFVAAAIGAPTVMIEKLFSVEDQHRAVSLLERFMGREATVIISAEIGGCNSMMPVAYAAMRGLPIVDADGMGRAFPELQMTSMNVNGVKCAPMTLSDEHGNDVLFQTDNGLKAEKMARPITAEMGASACMSCYPMTGAEAKQSVVKYTLSAALSIGAAIAEANESGDAPVARLLKALHAHEYYSDAYEIFTGKISGLERSTEGGWVLGSCTVAALNGRSEAKIAFQNENLTVHVDGVLRAVVPDLITIIDSESGHAIPTERLSYGQRVSVIGCSAPPQIKSEKALEIMGPQAFKLEEQYTPIHSINPPGAVIPKSSKNG
ncbi:MAG: DUF917 domain-containing protein [Sphingorhabdus sp.]